MVKLPTSTREPQRAYYAGVSVEMLRKLERGQANPCVQSLMSLSGALGYEIEIILIATQSQKGTK